ncbi:MAG TPA: toxin-antitoxin system YwqK family antitoxin [Bacteroidales bacterium]|nr:toxin-antitoxin system YwqK family antitoxin [Bacteroidales bacterium]
MKRYLTLLLILTPLLMHAIQPDSVYTVLRYPSGAISSEGWLVDGKPEGYWKNYHENGNIKSEGNRKNFLLDGIWKFYDEEGTLTLEISYEQGKRQGDRVVWLPEEIIRENFENDIRQGLTRHYDRSGRLLKTIPFVNGLEDGMSFTYDTTGTIIELVQYRRGFVTGRERINRRDSEGRPNGLWKWFFEDGSLKSEGVFKNGLRNGIFKTYDRKGNLLTIEKYIDDILQESAEEVATLELRRDFWPDGKLKTEATYRQGLPEGIRREYDREGNITTSYVFRQGVLLAEGVLDAAGLRQGFWKEFYPNGIIKSQGNYSNNLRIGLWEFYYPDGAIEQKGVFDEKGRPDGRWIWYFNNGEVLREENYRQGKLDGLMTEYDQDGVVIAQGEYLDDQREGFWRLKTGGFTEEGSYTEGMRTGTWKHFYSDGTLAFEGNFREDLPNGLHISYYPNGRKWEEGNWLMGRRNGEWKIWNQDGSLMLSILYVNGIERAYDGIRLNDEDVVVPEE